MQIDQEKYLEGETIFIDKDLHWTSFDVVGKIRGILRIKKVGHAGTLDPLATGLLIVCTGKMTKRIHEFQDLDKTYTGKFMLGARRPSHDRETEVIEMTDISHIDRAQVLQAAGGFMGEIKQVPPMHSAIKKEGKRLYSMARRGEVIEVEPRKVLIKSFEITGIDLPLVSFRLTCSKGFYVRALARDFGEVLGCGAYLEELRRTGIGDYTVEEAINIQEFAESLAK